MDMDIDKSRRNIPPADIDGRSARRRDIPLAYIVDPPVPHDDHPIGEDAIRR
jgi:hypothetical protein